MISVDGYMFVKSQCCQCNIRLDCKDEPSPLPTAKLLRTNQCCQILGFQYAGLNTEGYCYRKLAGTVRVNVQQ